MTGPQIGKLFFQSSPGVRYEFDSLKGAPVRQAAGLPPLPPSAFAGAYVAHQNQSNIRARNRRVLQRIEFHLTDGGRLSETRRRELHSLATIGTPSYFFEELLALAYHWHGQGDRKHSQPILKWLASGDSEILGAIPPQEIRDGAQRILKTGFADRDRPSWGSSLEESLHALSGDDLSRDFLQTTSWIGLLTLACSWARPLRPFAARGIYLLSEPRMAATILGTSAYHLYREAPRAKDAAARLLAGGDALGPSPWEDALTVLGFSVGVTGLALGTTSFGLGGRHGYLYGRNQLNAGATFGEAGRIGWRQGDAMRRAVMDPEVWVRFARGAPGLTAMQRSLLTYGARATEQFLVKGSMLYAGGSLVWGLHQRSVLSDSEGAPSLSSLFANFGLQAFPGVTLHLYRRGRGDRASHLGPALSQELREDFYRDPGLRQTALARLDRGLPKPTLRQRDVFMGRARNDFRKIESLLETGSRLAPLSQRLPAPPPQEIFLRSPETPSSKPGFSPVRYGPEALDPANPDSARRTLAQMDLPQLQNSFTTGRFSPLGVLRLLLNHDLARNGALFPREMWGGPLAKRLLQLAEASQARWMEGKPRPLEGVLVAVKDLFPDPEGLMTGGSKTGRYSGHAPSPVVQTLTELGAIPIPVGMVAAANGGAGLNTGFGYVPHPTREGFDPAGSSNAAAFAVGRPDLPITLAIGTDTGGSITAPAGAVGIFGFVPPAGMISMENMLPFATFLDRVGILAQHPEDAMRLADLIAKHVPTDPHMIAENPARRFSPSPTRPRLAYLEDLAGSLSPQGQKAFSKRIDSLRRKGFEVISLGSEWNFLSEVPLMLYPWDAYPAAVFTHTNPMQLNGIEPPRRTLDENLLTRLPLGGFSLAEGHFDRARALSERYRALVQEKLGPGVLLVSPSPEAIRTQELVEGRAGALLDRHDRITMGKNRIPEWGQVSLPDPRDSRLGMTFSGELPDLLHLLEFDRLVRYPVASRTPRALPVFVPPDNKFLLPPEGQSESGVAADFSTQAPMALELAPGYR